MTRDTARSALLATLVLLWACPAPAAPPAAMPQMHAGDERQDLPLLAMMADHQKQNMRGHLQAVSDIVAALASEDYAAIEKAAARMGYSPEMGRMCENFGRAAPQFTGQAVAFHHIADRIGAAARDHDHARVIATLADTLGACTACHAKWRQRVVDEATWAQLTALAAPAHD